MSAQTKPKRDFAAIRADFPRVADENKLFFAAGEYHPFTIHAIEVMQRYTEHRRSGPGGNSLSFTPELQAETKRLFADLINASPEEIAFVQSTTDGENIVLAGLDIETQGGNIVLDDLHFEASKYIYTQLAAAGKIELRIVTHKDWQVSAADYAPYIDSETRLVSVALVSQMNGFVADVKGISDMAHAHGAYLFADIIQGAGHTPIDVQAMGIDFCASSTYKWLMGEFGFGFLYVDQALQGSVVRKTRYGLRQVAREDDFEFDSHPGAAMYEGTSSFPSLPGLIAHTGLKYHAGIGIPAIREHVTPLINRLQKELPPLGYRPITPPGTQSSIVSFVPNDIERTRAQLEHAFDYPVLSFRTWHQETADGQREAVRGIRLGVSIYNNDDDVDRLIEVLSG